MPNGLSRSDVVNVPYFLTSINGISSICHAFKNFIAALPRTIIDTYQLCRNRGHFIMEDLYQRSEHDNITVAHVGLPFPSWPKIVVVGGRNVNVLQVASYGEAATKDPEARFVFKDVAKMLGVKTIANVQGAEATEQRKKLKQHILTSSFDKTFKVTQQIMKKGLDHWNDNLSFQHNISHMVVNILGQTVYGIPEVNSKYIPSIRRGASLLFGQNSKSKEFIAAQNEIKAMNVAILSEHADAILSTANYINDQIECTGKESREEKIQKLIEVRGASGLLVEGNVSGTLMIAIAHINESEVIKQTLRDELEAYLANHNGISSTDVKDQCIFPYLDCVYKESLRFLSPQAIIARKTSINTTLFIEDNQKKISAHPIPKHSYLFAPIRSIHHDARYWSNPSVFDPSRFEGRKRGERDDYFSPFSLGPRSCPAVSGFAEVIIKTALLIAIAYDIKLNKKVEQIRVGVMHSHWSEEYYAVSVTKRREAFEIEEETQFHQPFQ